MTYGHLTDGVFTMTKKEARRFRHRWMGQRRARLVLRRDDAWREADPRFPRALNVRGRRMSRNAAEYYQIYGRTWSVAALDAAIDRRAQEPGK